MRTTRLIAAAAVAALALSACGGDNSSSTTAAGATTTAAMAEGSATTADAMAEGSATTADAMAEGTTTTAAMAEDTTTTAAMAEGSATTTADAMAEGTATTAAMAEAKGNLMEVVAADPDLTILIKALGAADLYVTLANEGPFTIFAPTNEAFEKALKELGITADDLLKDKAKLAEILKYHVVKGSVMSADVAGLAGQSVETLQGGKLSVAVDGDKVKINNATVTKVDMKATNGVVHVIDTVLLPSG